MQNKYQEFMHKDMRSIPGSPFRYRDPHSQILKSNVERRQIGNGRFNMTFTMKTPSIKDSDIQNLIRRYPSKEKEETDEKIEFNEND